MLRKRTQSDTTALIDKNVDLDKVKKTLGDLDESNETEYLGPAPDGFELLEEETPFDEKAVKEQYQKLEEETQEKINKMEKDKTEKKTSQNPQNSVQRKFMRQAARRTGSRQKCSRRQVRCPLPHRA